jgi:hypothetical protein
MQILFNKTIEQCRHLGARGGRAYARNLRLRHAEAARSQLSKWFAEVHAQFRKETGYKSV